MKTLGLYLKERREQMELTQAQVASKLSLRSPQFISNIERGVSNAPLSVLKKMLVIYDIQIDEIVEIIVQEKRQKIKMALGGV